MDQDQNQIDDTAPTVDGAELPLPVLFADALHEAANDTGINRAIGEAAGRENIRDALTRGDALIDALLTIGCHAVANLHPESCRDVPADALVIVAQHLPEFYTDRTRATEIAQVWAERAAEVERWRQRRLSRDAGFSTPPSPFPAAIAGQYSQKVHGSPGVFATHDIGVDADGQPTVGAPKLRKPRKPGAPKARKPARGKLRVPEPKGRVTRTTKRR